MSQWPAISEIVKKVQTGELTATELVDKAIKTIEEKKEYNAVLQTITTRSHDRAREIDNKIKSGDKVGDLAGVPFIAKDNFLTFGSETTAASNILKGFNAPYQATAIEKLEAAGAICVGKANLDAFAHGSSTENSDFMITKNPADKTRVPGGSSGGSAAAVILDMVPFALGTDTGGSIRLPAAFCGAVGFKPSYGLVSRSGVVAMASSTDVVGPITKGVEDAAYVLEIIAGKDDLDSTTIERDEASYADVSTNLKGKKIGVINEYMDDGIDIEVKSAVEAAIAAMEKAGAEVVRVSLPSLAWSLACYYIIMPAEVSSNLSRYDGQRYGYSSDQADTLEQSYNWSRSEGFGKEAKRRIMIGTYVLSSGYYDAYYKKAQQVRTKLVEDFNRVFGQVDFLVGPTAPAKAFKIGEMVNDPMQMYLTDIMTVAANLTGVPSISIPLTKSEALPIGLQIMAPQKYDRPLLALAKEIERILA